MIKNIAVESNPDDRLKSSRLIIDFTDGYRVVHDMPHHLDKIGVSKRLLEFAAFIKNSQPPIVGNGWIKHDGSKSIDEGRYWVMSSYGVRMASYHNWGDCFQDNITNNDEGMITSSGKQFTVSHYQPIVEPEPPEAT